MLIENAKRMVGKIKLMEHLDMLLFMNFMISKPNSDYNFRGYDLYKGHVKLDQIEIQGHLISFYKVFNNELQYMTNKFKAEEVMANLRNNIHNIVPMKEGE